LRVFRVILADVYSLISAPVLGFDLTRMDGGAATAELLETMLAVPAGGWSAVAARVPGGSPELDAARDTALRLADAQPSVRDLPGTDPAGAVALLHRAPIGNLSALLHCVRTDVLVPGGDEAPDEVAAMATDAVSAAYVRALLTDDDRRELARGWLAVRRHLPSAPADLGPQQEQLERLLEAVRALPADRVPALTEAADQLRAGGADWAAAMHSLTWAVHMSGRARAAATVHMRLVQAVDLAGIPLAARAEGAWNLLSGAAQALVVRDLADTDSTALLLSPAIPALGAGWLFDA
jgi:hypothetical protein